MGRLYIFAAAVLWSLGGVFLKTIMVRHGVAPQALTCLRSLAAGVVLAWALPGIRGVPKGRTALAGVAYSALVLTYVLANAYTTAANAILLQYFYPLIVAVAAVWLFRERPRPRTLAALLLGTVGVAVIAAGSWEPTQWAGVTCGLLSAVFFAAFVLLQRGIDKGSPVGLASLYNLMAAAMILPLAWGKLSLSPTAYGLIALQGVVQIGIPYVLFMKGLRRTPVVAAAVITLAEPVLNPLWTWIGVREVPSGWTLIGGAVIVAALLVQFTAKSRRDEPGQAR